MEAQKLDVAKAQDALRDLWKDPRCPFSGHNQWTVARDYVELRPYFGGSMVVGGTVYPGVMVVCNGCGYMALFSAVKLGLLAKEETPSKEAESDV